MRPSPNPPADPADLESLFAAERPRLVGLAYRITGSRLDAEDLVQEAWLRAQGVDWATVERPAAWLTTVVSRLALDDLRSARHRRETYVGPWLPEPILAPGGVPVDPADEVALAESLTLGFLRLLEKLTPLERVVFLLADVFATPYREIAEVVGRSPESCRQLATRARRSLRDHETARRRRGHDAPPDAARVAEDLFAALVAGDVDQVVALLADDVVLVSDGGPDHFAARRPVHGPHRVARLAINIARRGPKDGVTGAVAASINGEPGVILKRGDELFLAVAVHVGGGRVHEIHAIRNPAKLAALEIASPVV